MTLELLHGVFVVCMIVVALGMGWHAIQLSVAQARDDALLEYINAVQGQIHAQKDAQARIEAITEAIIRRAEADLDEIHQRLEAQDAFIKSTTAPRTRN